MTRKTQTTRPPRPLAIRLGWRRPRRAERIRAYVAWPAGDLAPLALGVRLLLAARRVA